LRMRMVYEHHNSQQHPAVAYDWLNRSDIDADLKNFIAFTLNNRSGRTIDDVIRLLQLRLLNNFDAIQTWVSLAL
jgi:hypothetical protein